MRILLYSKNCDFCLKLLEYLDTKNINDFFNNKICLDEIDIPQYLNTNNLNIKDVPAIIDDEIEAPLEGKKAFEYVINQKYFNHPTNNVDFVKNGIPKPTIEEDKKAITSKTGGFIYVDNTENDTKNHFDKVFNIQPKVNIQTPPTNLPTNTSSDVSLTQKKSDALLRLRGPIRR